MAKPAQTSPGPGALLLPAALAGTRRQPFAPLPGLTPPLGAEAYLPEKQLLLTAANLRLAQRAGQRAQPGPAFDLGRTGPETRPVLGTAHVQLLRELLQNIPASVVWGPCLAALARHGHLAELDQLALVQELPDYPRQVLIPPHWLSSVRRHWLATCKVESWAWHHHRAQPLTTGWAAVEPGQRYYNLLLLGQQRPPGGWQWLLAELKTSPSEHQSLLLRVLRDWAATAPVPAEFGPVLEPLVAGPDGHYVAELLVQLPGNALLERHWARARPLFAYAPGATSLTVKTVAWQKTWDSDQISNQPYSVPPLPAEQQVLRQLLSWVPPTRWLAPWGIPAAEAVALAAATAYGAAVLGGWLDAAVRYRDPAMIQAVLTGLNSYPLLQVAVCGASLDRGLLRPALAVLPPSTRVAWLLTQLPALPLSEPVGAGHDLLYLPSWACCLETGLSTDLPALGPPLLDWLLTALELPARLLPVNMPYIIGRLFSLLPRHVAEALPLLPRLETELLPLLQAQPGHPLTERLQETIGHLGYYRDFMAHLASMSSSQLVPENA